MPRVDNKTILFHISPKDNTEAGFISFIFLRRKKTVFIVESNLLLLLKVKSGLCMIISFEIL